MSDRHRLFMISGTDVIRTACLRWRKSATSATPRPQFVYLKQDELIKLLLQCDLYVHASDMESEAISCIEAFATGLVPVIANSELSATRQFALDDRSLFLPGNPKDLARAIDYWLDNPQERECMEKAYVKAAKKYSLDISVRMFEEMLNEEIEEQKGNYRI